MKHTPIINGLKKYIDEENIRFHMPGHKGKDQLKFLGKLIPMIDVTEVPGVDNLHNAKEIIDESQKNASRVFKAKKTFYSVNGTTAGIYAAITSQTTPNDKILISRDSHKSVYQSLVLGNLDCEYIYPNYNESDHILTGIDIYDVEKKLEEDLDIKLVVVNYPSYYGVCADIERLADIVHKHNRLLIVDEAHGSHLSFHKDLPKSALEAGADIVIQSTHKTLPAFTQSSMVHIGSNRVDIERLSQHMSIYQTTSPSYILLSSLDYATDYMEIEGHARLDTILKKIDEITDYLEKINGIKIYKKAEGFPYDFDKTKFLFKVEGISGTRLEKILRDDYKIQVEMSDHYYCLALVSPLDDIEDLEKLKEAIEDIAKNNEYKEKQRKDFIDIRRIEAQKKITTYKAFYSDKISVQLKESIGEISADFIVPYPPGIPILAPGEIITKEIVDYIEILTCENIEILGLLENYKKIKIIL